MHKKAFAVALSLAMASTIAMAAPTAVTVNGKTISAQEQEKVIKQIVSNAFGWEQAIGGGMGAAIMQGVKRGLFSNEAGMGSAPNVAATATTSHPVKQGLVQVLSVFIDTVLICSATALPLSS